MCDTTHFICVTWLMILFCVMSHYSLLWHDPLFLFVSWLVLFTCVTSLITSLVLLGLDPSPLLFTCVTSLITSLVLLGLDPSPLLFTCVTPLITSLVPGGTSVDELQSDSHVCDSSNTSQSHVKWWVYTYHHESIYIIKYFYKGSYIDSSLIPPDPMNHHTSSHCNWHVNSHVNHLTYMWVTQ